MGEGEAAVLRYSVIKENDIFLLFDRLGDVSKAEEAGLGLYTRDTRFLSRMECYLNGRKPTLLDLKTEGNNEAVVLATNPELTTVSGSVLPPNSLFIRRHLFISGGALYERILLRNYHRQEIEVNLDLYVEADFTDIFEVRGCISEEMGRNPSVTVGRQEMVFHYRGADGLARRTEIKLDPAPDAVSGKGRLGYQVKLPVDGTFGITVFVAPLIEGEPRPSVQNTTAVLRSIKKSRREWLRGCTEIVTDNADFNAWIKQSLNDLRALMVDFGDGLFPVAGIPWFAVPFGRDSIITAVQTLMLNPSIARAIIRTLARYQGQKVDPWRDEQPGKIPHEIRRGELANIKRIPHTPYYGTVDATPLFLVLLSEYYHWTGDEAFLREYLPAVDYALGWIDQYGDRDGDGFVEYLKESPAGIENQGWKDSGDSIVHKSGALAEAPIALAEVQGYIYDAKVKWAAILDRMGYYGKAAELRQSAGSLKQNFLQAFWMEGDGFIALALDKNKRQVETVASNGGHCLWSGLLDKQSAQQVVRRLLAPDMFSGYGIRTMSSKARAYNPISYHNGSVWPHDNSLIVMGLVRYGFRQEANRVIEGLFQAARYFNYRLPELFCGFAREEGRPVPYPAACSPQAWAAGTVFLLLQAILGLFPRVAGGEVFLDPVLPESISYMRVKNLQVGSGTVDLLVQREGGSSCWELLRNSSGLRIVRGLTHTAA
ncbi:amylo-alpha-1,6-glucosidase [Thermanaeromonas sp. C210]|nr:amylo-alpha-1,6-glucosidase [Thermanaeromonas sp. C210]